MKNPLIGKTLTGLALAKDKKAIRFDTTDGEIVVLVDGDCCSSTWIEHVELPVSFPCVVADVENLPLRAEEEHGESVTEFYGLKITTDKGAMVIDYRNESNGYYGGNLVWPGEHQYGGVYGQNLSTLEWESLA